MEIQFGRIEAFYINRKFYNLYIKFWGYVKVFPNTTRYIKLLFVKVSFVN